MARIRTIKPEFWDHEQLGKMSPLARLTFLGMMSLADDSGVGRAGAMLQDLHKWASAGVRSNWRRACAELEAVRDHRGPLVVFYEVAGARYYWLPGFNRQQRIDKPQKSKFPPPPNSENDPRCIKDQGSRIKDQGEEGREEAAPPPPSPPVDEVERLLMKRARDAKIIAREDTMRRYIQGWRERAGAKEVERVLMLPEIRGLTLIEIQDRHFANGNGRDGPPDLMKQVWDKFLAKGDGDAKS